MNKVKKIKNLCIAGLVLYLLSNKTYKLIKGDIRANNIIKNHTNYHIENIVAHRGFSGLYRENSVESIIEALKLPCVDMIEIDIRFTKNNIIVLHHDGFINTEDLFIQIEDLTLDDDLEELITNDSLKNSLDNLIYDDTLFLQKRYLSHSTDDDKVIRLSKILRMYDFSKPLILDVKTDLIDLEMIESLNRLVSNYKDYIFIQSDNYLFLNKMMEIYPDYKYLYIINSINSLKNLNNRFYGYTVKCSLLDKIKIDIDKMYLIYTINSNQKYLNLLRNKNYNNSMYIITDNPDYICAIGEDKKVKKVGNYG